MLSDYGELDSKYPSLFNSQGVIGGYMINLAAIDSARVF
jgi:hypothetical membrane protein